MRTEGEAPNRKLAPYFSRLRVDRFGDGAAEEMRRLGVLLLRTLVLDAPGTSCLDIFIYCTYVPRQTGTSRGPA